MARVWRDDAPSLCACRSVPTPIIDEVLKHWPQAGVPANDVQYPEGWVDERQEAIRFFALQGPEWAALDFRLNPWGKLSDGAWDLITDKCALRHTQTARTQVCLPYSSRACLRHTLGRRPR